MPNTNSNTNSISISNSNTTCIICILLHFGVENSGTYCGRRALGNRCSIEQRFVAPFRALTGVMERMFYRTIVRYILCALAAIMEYMFYQTNVLYVLPGAHCTYGTYVLSNKCSSLPAGRPLANRCSIRCPLHARSPGSGALVSRTNIRVRSSKKGSRTFVRLPCHPEWSGAFQEQMYDVPQLLPWI